MVLCFLALNTVCNYRINCVINICLPWQAFISHCLITLSQSSVWYLVLSRYSIKIYWTNEHEQTHEVKICSSLFSRLSIRNKRWNIVERTWTLESDGRDNAGSSLTTHVTLARGLVAITYGVSALSRTRWGILYILLFNFHKNIIVWYCCFYLISKQIEEFKKYIANSISGRYRSRNHVWLVTMPMLLNTIRNCLTSENFGFLILLQDNRFVS